MHNKKGSLGLNNQWLINNKNLYLVTEIEKANHKTVIQFIFTDKNFELKQNKTTEVSSVLESKVQYF